MSAYRTAMLLAAVTSILTARAAYCDTAATDTASVADAAPAATSALEEVTITASKMAVTQAQMPQASTVLTDSQLRDQVQTGLIDALRQEPGIQFQVGGGPGQSLNTRLRGFADTTLYVLDGITINEAGSGDIGYLLGQLDPTMVQRLEVLRGPRATLYGANTTSGVIAITTLTADHPQTDVSVEAGSLDWKKLRAGTQNSLPFEEGTWSYSLNGSWIDSGGANRWEFYQNATVVARTSYKRDHIEIGASFYGSDNEFQNADLIESIAGATQSNYFAVQIPDPSNVDQTKAGIASLWVEQQITPTLSQKLTIGGAGQDFSVTNGDTANGGLIGHYTAPYDGWTDPDTYTVYGAGQSVPVYQTAYTYRTIADNKEADYNLRYRSDFVSAVLGATYIGQVYDQGGSYGGEDENQSIRSIYGDAASNWFGNTLHALLGARLDSYSAWASKATYSIGASYDVRKGVSFFANYGSSFTQPTLDELYNPTYGNKAITPENAATVEGGLRARQLDDRLSEDLTLWHSYVSNVIIYDYSIFNPRVPGSYGEYANSAAERSQGVEAEASYRIVPSLRLTANYTHTDAYVMNAAGQWSLMIENARNMGNLALSYQVAQFEVGTNYYVTDHRLRWAGDVWAPSYTRLDVYGRYHLTSRFDLYARVQNLLDRDIVEILGYRSPGVYAVGGASYRF